MDARKKWFLATLTIVLLAIGTSWWWLPQAVDMLPGQIRGRLPEGFVALVTTPLPTALPGPLRPADAAMLVSPTATLETLPPTSTLRPTVRETPDATGQGAGAPNTTRAPAATATRQPSPTPTSTLSPLPEEVRIEGLSVIAQKYNNCGPANLTIVLDYYGLEVQQMEIGEALKPNYDDRNVSPDELVRYVREETDHEALALYGLDLKTLRSLLAAGFPVIIEKGLDLGAPHGWMGHYLTLYGYDANDSTFLGLDTFLGPWDSTGRPFEFTALESLWAQFNRATVVVYSADQAGTLAQAVGPDVLDEATMWLGAAQRAHEALAVDPDDAFAWFDLGASLYHLGALGGDGTLFDQSAVAFDRAREIGLPWRTLWYQFEPYLAYIAAGRFDEVLALTEAVMTTSGGRNIEETYLFRGHALLASGDPSGAERAYERALRLNPGLDAAREALANLNASAAGSGG